MIEKCTPVMAKVSTVVKAYVGVMLIGCGIEVFRSGHPILTLETLLYVVEKELWPLMRGLLVLLVIWAIMAADWRKGGERRVRERLAYKQSLPEIERHLYEIEEFDARLPEGPKRKKNRFTFLTWKKFILKFQN